MERIKSDAEVDAINAEQLRRALIDLDRFYRAQDGEDFLEELALLPDTRPE